MTLGRKASGRFEDPFFTYDGEPSRNSQRKRRIFTLKLEAAEPEKALTLTRSPAASNGMPCPPYWIPETRLVEALALADEGQKVVDVDLATLSDVAAAFLRGEDGEALAQGIPTGGER